MRLSTFCSYRSAPCQPFYRVSQLIFFLRVYFVYTFTVISFSILLRFNFIYEACHYSSFVILFLRSAFWNDWRIDRSHRLDITMLFILKRNCNYRRFFRQATTQWKLFSSLFFVFVLSVIVTKFYTVCMLDSAILLIHVISFSVSHIVRGMYCIDCSSAWLQPSDTKLHMCVCTPTQIYYFTVSTFRP